MLRFRATKLKLSCVPGLVRNQEREVSNRALDGLGVPGPTSTPLCSVAFPYKDLLFAVSALLGPFLPIKPRSAVQLL